MRDKIEYTETGLKCDNVECGYKDATIKSIDYEDWINKPCPNCGENLLTLEDFKNVRILEEFIRLANSAENEEEIADDKFISVEVDTHKGINFKNIQSPQKTKNSKNEVQKIQTNTRTTKSIHR